MPLPGVRSARKRHAEETRQNHQRKPRRIVPGESFLKDQFILHKQMSIRHSDAHLLMQVYKRNVLVQCV